MQFSAEEIRVELILDSHEKEEVLELAAAPDPGGRPLRGPEGGPRVRGVQETRAGQARREERRREEDEEERKSSPRKSRIS